MFHDQRLSSPLLSASDTALAVNELPRTASVYDDHSKLVSSSISNETTKDTSVQEPVLEDDGESTCCLICATDERESMWHAAADGDVDGDNTIRGGIDASTAIARKKLIQASILCGVIMIVEVVCGYLANSLALLTDASHLLSDLSSFLISLFAIWAAHQPGTKTHSFGFYRAEILGACVSILMIWVITGFLIVQAVHRVINPQAVNGRIMLITAVFGTAANLVTMNIFGMHSHGLGGHGKCSHSHKHADDTKGCDDQHDDHHHDDHHHDHHHDDHHHDHHHNEQHDTSLVILNTHGQGSSPVEEAAIFNHRVSTTCVHKEEWLQPIFSTEKENLENDTPYDPTPTANLNLRAAYIHTLGDLIQNIGVMIAAVIIWINPKWALVDPICTFVFAILVCFTTTSILREAVNVLMEGAPVGIDLSHLREDLLSIPAAVGVHDLHAWSLSVGKQALCCHIVVDEESSARRVLRVATYVVQVKYGILHTTIQVDFSQHKSACDTNAHARCA